MQKALPELLTSAASTGGPPAERAADLLRKATAKDWREIIGRALEILDPANKR